MSQSNKEIKQQLNERSSRALSIMKELLDAIEEIGKISPNDPNPENEEEIKEYEAFFVERDMRIQLILKQILCRYGNFIFL